MPDDVVGTSADTVSVTDPTATAPGNTAETTPTAPPQSAEPTFQIDGRDVPYDEVVKGYLRQSDYTVKTQALAQERQQLAEAQQLWEAFNADPVRTLEVLSQYVGQAGDQASVEEADPYEQRLSQIEAQQQAEAEYRLQLEIEDEIADLQDRYGEVERDELLLYAIEHEIPDLEAALLKQRAAQEKQSAIEQHNRQALAAKRGLPPIAGGSHAGDAYGRQAGPINNVADAMREAMAELGVESFDSLSFG